MFQGRIQKIQKGMAGTLFSLYVLYMFLSQFKPYDGEWDL